MAPANAHPGARHDGAASGPEPRRPPGAPATSTEGLPRLTRLQFWSIFGVALAIFFFSQGPVWRSVWRMDTLNLAIFYSYLPIPFLVTAGLAQKKRLGLRAFFLDTLEIALLKYVVTFGFALFGWALSPAPPRTAEPVAPRAPAPVEALPAPTPIPPDQAGVIEGAVVDADGRPRKGALVFVASGLEGHVFAAPGATLTLANDGAGVTPRLAAAQLHQPIQARSTDGHLHTLVIEKDGRVIANVPLLGSGAPSPVALREAHGVTELRCMVHQRSAAEAASHLAVFAHPFFAITGDDGRFRWEGVPAGALRVAAWDRERGEIAHAIRVEGRRTAEIRLAFDAR
jgi:hypothetical protein